MVPVMPHLSVAGDNPHGYDRENGELFRAADDNDCSIRPRIMARSGQLRGISPNRAVWCFGFTRDSEAHHAYGVALPDGKLFTWVLATHDGEIVHIVNNCPAINLPANFRSVIEWDEYALMKARADLFCELPERPDEPKTIAVVYANDGTVLDRTWNWESAQNYALSEGLRVVAIADDGHMTMKEIQDLCDAERARWLDCFVQNVERQSPDTSSMGERCRWNDA